MSAGVTSKPSMTSRIVDHLVRCVEATVALNEPFSHMYLDGVFPNDIYQQLLRSLPDPKLYKHASERYQTNDESQYVRSMFALTPAELAVLQPGKRELWVAVAAALTAREVQQAVFKKLAKDLAFRYGVTVSEVEKLAGYSRPTLYRETAGFEIPPHPDTRKKVVTMQLYLPADRSQLDLGTALYQRRLLAWPFGTWQQRFVKVKQFAFQPNSAYAFVVNNTLTKKSWHGRETLPPGAGVRNTLLNTFYAEAREEFSLRAA